MRDRVKGIVPADVPLCAAVNAYLARLLRFGLGVVVGVLASALLLGVFRFPVLAVAVVACAVLVLAVLCGLRSRPLPLPKVAHLLCKYLTVSDRRANPFL